MSTRDERLVASNAAADNAAWHMDYLLKYHERMTAFTVEAFIGMFEDLARRADQLVGKEGPAT